MQSMSTERLEQGFRGGYTHLQEKVTSAVVLLQDIVSQSRVLSTMEKELHSRGTFIDEHSSSQVESLMKRFKTEIERSFPEATLLQNQKSPPSTGSPAQVEESLNTELTSLKQQIASMKGSRDKLLFEIDRLSVELDYATAQQQLLKKQEKEQATLAKYWKEQSIERGRQIDRLKEMLDESAEVCRETQPTQAEVFSDVSKRVADELQWKGMMTKLVTSEQKNNELRETWLPTLRSLEARLMDLNSAATDAFD